MSSLRRLAGERDVPPEILVSDVEIQGVRWRIGVLRELARKHEAEPTLLEESLPDVPVCQGTSSRASAEDAVLIPDGVGQAV